jgi:hypothetical protein
MKLVILTSRRCAKKRQQTNQYLIKPLNFYERKECDEQIAFSNPHTIEDAKRQNFNETSL